MFKRTVTLLAVGTSLCASFGAFGQYNPNIQYNPNNQGFQDAQNFQNQQNFQYQQSQQASQAAASVYSSAAANPFGQSGYTNDGTLMMGGQRIGNPHQVLHDAAVPAFMTITANRYTYTDNPYAGLAAGPYPNLQTYADVLKDAQKTNYLPTAVDDGKIYVFKTLSTASTQSQNILIKELPNTSQFKAAADPLGGGVGVRVAQNGDAVALSNYLATIKPYDFSWQSAFGPYAAMANYGGPVVFGANGNVNGINPYLDPASFYFNWVMGSDQVQSFQNTLNQQSQQSGNESFGQLVWDSNTNQYVMLSASNTQATAGSISGTMPTLGAGQTGVFGMHTHSNGSQPSNQDLWQASQLGMDQVILGGNGLNYVVVPGSGGIGGGEFKFENGYLGSRGIRSSSTGNGASTGPQHGYVVIGAKYVGDPNALIVSYGRDENGNLTRASSSSDLNQNDRKDWLNKDGNFNLLVDKSGNPISDDKLQQSAENLTNYLNNNSTSYVVWGQNSNSAATSTALNAGANNPSIPGWAPGSGTTLPTQPATYPTVDAMGVPTGGTSTY